MTMKIAAVTEYGNPVGAQFGMAAQYCVLMPKCHE